MSAAKEFIRGEANLRSVHHGCVATIGSFDGVHLGHQAIIRQVADQSKALKLPAVAVIFEPQPREFFGAPAARIMPLREKALALFEAGVDRILCLHFNRKFSEIGPQQFVQRVLVDGLGVRHLVVGDDFRFGKDRAGDDGLLLKLATEFGFETECAASVELDGERVSSTRIRECLAGGNFGLAAKLLGGDFQVSGQVRTGRQLGSQLGVPTMNVTLRRMLSPVQGSFAVTVTIEGYEKCFKGVANVGVRPTVGGDSPLLEAHLFDFNESVYGRRITVTFKQKLRDEKKFSSLAELKEQIGRDIAAARHIFSSKT